jgi:hypothetical protein
MGSLRRWARWVLTLVALVLVLRLTFATILPLLPHTVAWGSAIALGAALTLFLLPLPHEATR